MAATLNIERQHLLRLLARCPGAAAETLLTMGYGFLLRT
jgi:hypothetical protein